MYYLLIPIVAFIFFIRLFIVLADDINHKFHNFDYRYSYNLRSTEDLLSYIEELADISIPDKDYDSKILPPYSDYNINQNFNFNSQSIEVFYKD